MAGALNVNASIMWTERERDESSDCLISCFKYENFNVLITIASSHFMWHVTYVCMYLLSFESSTAVYE
jgi:hypothetical protein